MSDNGFNVFNPIIIVEILSSGTKNYDRGEKFKLYRKITALPEHVLVGSGNTHIEVFKANESNHRELEEYGANCDLPLFKAIGKSVLLSETYDGVPDIL